MSAKAKYDIFRIKRNRKWRNETKMLERWFRRNTFFGDENSEYCRLLAHGAALETIAKAFEAKRKEIDDELR